MKTKLLPVGFYDLLFDEAQKTHQNINALLEFFFSREYKLIRTPLVEFEENFAPQEITNSFCATDIISGKNLVFRSDITLQIARILSTKLSSQTSPLKLCYVGDVLCAKSENLFADRQQTQVGVEIIDCDQEKSNFEIIEISLAALQKLALKNLLIEFSLPDFLGIFLAEISAQKNDELAAAILQKNLSAIKNLAGENAEIISKIALRNDNLEILATEILQKFSRERIAKELQRAQKISQFLREKFGTVTARFDLFGDHKSSYHQEISFDIFCGNFPYAIARGGRYKINDRNAVGATIYMNALRKI